MWDAMIDMYEKYGYYLDSVKSVTMAGIEGQAQIQKILDTLRADAPTTIGSYQVLSARDYQTGVIKIPGYRRRNRDRPAGFQRSLL